jgi:hypothetical protein
VLTANKRNVLIAVGILLAAALAGWFAAGYYFIPSEKTDSPLIELKDSKFKTEGALASSGENTITVMIFLPSGDAVIAEERTVQNKTLAVEIAETVLTEYIKGLKEGFDNTKLNGVYRDRNNTIYIDLSDEFRRGFSGDARQEYALLKSLFETVTKNVPETEDVRLLIDGREIESIGGHFSILYGLKIIFAD